MGGDKIIEGKPNKNTDNTGKSVEELRFCHGMNKDGSSRAGSTSPRVTPENADRIFEAVERKTAEIIAKASDSKETVDNILNRMKQAKKPDLPFINSKEHFDALINVTKEADSFLPSDFKIDSKLRIIQSFTNDDLEKIAKASGNCFDEKGRDIRRQCQRFRLFLNYIEAANAKTKIIQDYGTIKTPQDAADSLDAYRDALNGINTLGQLNHKGRLYNAREYINEEYKNRGLI